MNKNKYLHILLPCKGLATGKSRLADVLDDSARSAFNRWMLQHTMAVATAWLGDARRCVVISPDEAVLVLARDNGVVALHDEKAELNAALGQGTAYAVSCGAQRVLVLPCDLPLLSEDALELLMSCAVRENDMVIAPDRRGGGTNALLTNVAVADFAFGENSVACHKALAAARGTRAHICKNVALAFDIDTPDDYRVWLAQNAAAHGESMIAAT